MTFADFISASEADIEDMIDLGFYLKLVTLEYGSSLSKKPLVKDLKKGHPRVVVRLEEFFESNPIKNGHRFNHYRPARYLNENLGTLTKSIPSTTLDRFEEAFKRLNSLL